MSKVPFSLSSPTKDAHTDLAHAAGTSSYRSWLAGAILITALLSCLVPAIGSMQRFAFDHRQRRISPVATIPERTAQLDAMLAGSSMTPGRAQSARLNLTSINPADVELAVGRLQLRHNPGLSLLLHAAALYGLEMKVPEHPDPAGATLKQVLLDSDSASQYFQGNPLFVESTWGVRNRTQTFSRRQWETERQAHAGQLLCELAKHGVPLREQITIHSQSFDVKDLLRDTMANFNLKESEIEWNFIALMLYLPPQRSWIDKFGTHYSFDDLAEELLVRKAQPEAQPCFGIHRLEGLALLLQLDHAHHLLSPASRNGVVAYLAQEVKLLIATQSEDGSWPETWYLQEASGTDGASARHRTINIHRRVHVTGHHVDWLLLLPSDLIPHATVFENAGQFLLKAILSAEDEDLLKHYCPYSHAAHSLRLLSSNDRR